MSHFKNENSGGDLSALKTRIAELYKEHSAVIVQVAKKAGGEFAPHQKAVGDLLPRLQKAQKGEAVEFSETEKATLQAAAKAGKKLLALAGIFPVAIAEQLETMMGLAKAADRIKETKENNGADGTPEKQTARIVTFNKKNAFPLFDESLKPIVDKNRKSVVLNEGQEVVKLTATLEGGDYNEIIVWLNGEYYRGFVVSGALADKDPDEEISDRNLLLAFLNDVEHAIFRAEQHIKENNPAFRFSKEMQEAYRDVYINAKIKFEKSFEDAMALLQKIKKSVKLLRKKKLKLNNALIAKIQQKQNDLLKLTKEKPAEAIQAVEEQFYKTNASIGAENRERLKNSIVVVYPLSLRWFEQQDKAIQDIYDGHLRGKKMLTQKGGNGDVGELWPSDSGEAQLLIKVVQLLKEQLDKIPESAEKKWISSVSMSQLNSAKEFICFDHGTFDYDYSALFASQVAISQQFGTLKIAPLQTILTHELQVVVTEDPRLVGSIDTHVVSDRVAISYQEIADERNIDILQMKPTDIDALYQSNTFLELLNINYVLEELKNL